MFNFFAINNFNNIEIQNINISFDCSDLDNRLGVEF